MVALNGVTYTMELGQQHCFGVCLDLASHGGPRSGFPWLHLTMTIFTYRVFVKRIGVCLDVLFGLKTQISPSVIGSDDVGVYASFPSRDIASEEPFL